MAKKSSLTFGIILLIAGIWGFVSSPILGLFAASAISGIIHVIAGIILLAMMSKPAAVKVLETIGVVYVLMAVVGFVQGTQILFFPTNGAANWLYLVLGILMFAFGWSAGKGMPVSNSAPSSTPQM